MTATKRKPKPITANPMFPFVTALWLATFFGLGSFAVAPALLEGPVAALGIPALVPAAAPPLGFTARVMFALAMMGFGAVAGFVVGRLLGREKIEAPVRMRGFGKSASEAKALETCRPINAVEDLGEPLDAPVTDEVPPRRRALSLQEESPFADLAESAPLPGGMAWERAPVPEAGTVDAEAGVLEAVLTDHMHPPSLAVVDPLALDLLFEEASAAGHQPFTPIQHDMSEDLPDFDLELAADLEWHDSAASETESVVPSGMVDQPLSVASEEPSYLLQAYAVTATPIDRAPLDTLGLVQLIERLALAISRRTAGARSVEHAAPAEFVVVAPAPPPAIARFASSSSTASPGVLPHSAEPEAVLVAEPEHAEPEQAERVVQLRPSALQPIRSYDLAAPEIASEDEYEDEDLGLERFLRMSPVVIRNRTPVVDATEADAADADIGPEPEVIEDRYPSLLDMGAVTGRREPLRIDDSADADGTDAAGIEPVVVFPGHESPLQAGPVQAGQTRPFERPSIMPLAGSPLASPGRAAPSSPVPCVDDVDMVASSASLPDAEEADRALRAALATLQRMTAQG